ncbi:MAG: GNAT family N-acetyltransferase, partial [Candidatus Hodarchaeota archaeon]
LGLFSLITLAPYRRKGVATSINRVLALWGKRNDAQKVYLQVVPENKPAFALYQELGFNELYHYWCRWLP